MVDPFFGAIGALQALGQMGGGALDRILKLRDAKLDAKALRRMLLLEVHYNLAILDVAIGRKEPLTQDALWRVPPLLQTQVFEAVLGSSKEATLVAKSLKGLKIQDEDLISESSGVIANLYSRLVALQGLAALHRQVVLKNVKIDARLKNLRSSLQDLRKALGQKEG